MKSLLSRLPRPITRLCLAFVVLGIAGSTVPLAEAAPSLDEIRNCRAQKGREDAAWLVRQDLAEPDAALSALMERRKARLNYSLMQDGMRVSRDAAVHGRARDDKRIVRAAAEFAEQRAFWSRELQKTGAWIHRNPVVGGYVFNNVIDLCGLLWRIGREFNRPE